MESDFTVDRSGQYRIDVTLESERGLKDNLQKVVQFVHDQRALEAQENGTPLTRVRNKHEGYGIAAEAYTRIQAAEKTLKGGMADYLNLLQAQGDDSVQICGTIYTQALELASEAIGLASDATRILDDLYYAGGETPLERYLEDQDDDEEED